jgi:hypothetical protein
MPPTILLRISAHWLAMASPPLSVSYQSRRVTRRNGISNNHRRPRGEPVAPRDKIEESSESVWTSGLDRRRYVCSISPNPSVKTVTTHQFAPGHLVGWLRIRAESREWNMQLQRPGYISFEPGSNEKLSRMDRLSRRLMNAYTLLRSMS